MIDPSGLMPDDFPSMSEEKAPQMNVSCQRTSNVECQLDVEIPWEEVKSRLDDAYVGLQKGVALKGFRKGKVPRKMLEQLLGKHVYKEVAARLVHSSLVKAIEDNSISAVSEPDIKEEGIVEGAAYRYKATVQVVPEIEPHDYFDVEVKQRKVTVSDEDLTRALKAKQLEHAEYKPVEGRATQAGDMLLVDLIGKIDDEPYSRDGALVELGEDVVEPIPGLAAKLTGLAPDQNELDVELEFALHKHEPGEKCPGDEPKKKARLLVTVKDRKQQILPTLDDDFAKDTGDAQSLEELKQVLRGQLSKREEDRAREDAKQRLLSTITKRNNVPVVPALVDRYLDRTMSFQMMLMGIDPRTVGDTDQTREMKEKMRGSAEEMVKSVLLLEAISKKENVVVSDEDVDKKLADIAEERGQNLARIKSEYEKEGRLTALRSSLREEKTLDLLMSKAKITVTDKVEDEKEEK